MISFSNNIYTLQYSESYAGSVFMTVSNEPFLALEDALNKIFLSSQLDYNSALLTVGCNTVAILRISEVDFKVFDSHSKDTYGMPHSFGKCVLVTIFSIPDLVTYFQSISAQVGGNLPYEIKGVSISFNATEHMNVDKSSSPNENGHFTTKHKQTTRSQQSITSECGGKLTKTQKYYRERLQNETAEQRERRLSKQREYKRKQRANQSPESRAEKLRQRRQYEKQRIQHETPEKRIGRLSKLKRHAANVFQNETPDQRVQRLLNLKQHNLQIFQNETPEERDKRLSQIRQHRTQVIENETLEKKNERLSKLRQHRTQVLQNETPEERQKRLLKKRK